ncbi:MAG: hypothetical protein IMZ74_10955, partial [Actinobacteria bacterium]|nr:hypothetical protein [Actinomycetota bacterium]
MRHTFRSATLLLALLAAARVASAQATAAFTAEDMLKVASLNVLDVSEDGTRIAATVRRGIDNPTVDNRRYGDPTYLSPAKVVLQVIDANTGAVDLPFRDTMVSVRDAAWSRDGKRLALLVAQDGSGAGGFPTTTLHIWDADRKTLTEVRTGPDARVAVNSNLAWTPDGSALVVALRSLELDRAAAQHVRPRHEL